MSRKWIPKNIDEGAFKAYMKRRFGKAAFNKDGTLKVSYINKVLKDPKTPTKRKRQAALAKAFKRISKKRK